MGVVQLLPDLAQLILGSCLIYVAAFPVQINVADLRPFQLILRKKVSKAFGRSRLTSSEITPSFQG